MAERRGTKALELWCKRLVKDCPNVQIDNMTTSWRNGIAFCALVHHFRPDLIDLSTLNPEDVYHNNQLAFNIAEKQLGIPALLDPEDMVENDVPDRLSILTYLSQFYQRLGHTVSPKYNTENESKENVSISPLHTPSNVSKNFVKADLDKCTICGQSVYLAQRLIVSHKLYHRRCFRCSKCSVQLSPSSCPEIKDLTICCDSCKNESATKCYNNNDVQMGMLEFSESLRTINKPEDKGEETVSSINKPKPLSVLEKISLFEKNNADESSEEKFSKRSLQDVSKLDDTKAKSILESKWNDNENIDSVKSTKGSINGSWLNDKSDVTQNDSQATDNSLYLSTSSKPPSPQELLDNLYKTNVNKFNFLQTQLSSEKTLDVNSDIILSKAEDLKITDEQDKNDSTVVTASTLSNLTDDIRIAETYTAIEINEPTEVTGNKINFEDEKINIPPRLKKAKKDKLKKEKKEYPNHLNPFSEDEEEDDVNNVSESKKESTNPFGSSDEEEDEAPPTAPAPMKRLIAVNPFWSDGEEPSSDEEESRRERSSLYKSSMATSTPNLPTSVPRRKKAPAPLPPVISVLEVPTIDNACSMDDVASVSSLSSYNSTAHSDHKTPIKLTPRSRKKKLAPTPPDSLSFSTSSTLEASANLSSLTEGGTRRVKGPAPGLPLPERREVKLQMSPEELHVQLDILETQQLGLERQGVLIEQMIRDKCEGDETCSVPQEEVEDLVIQLCELVNEKNDLFRKHTELMYIRRQQRLEQEQADIEHEIRVLQSRPAVNKMDSDKVREEQLVSRLVEIVRLRDELVQQLDSERRRERQEDLAIAASIANKRAQRNSDSNTSSMKSFEEPPTPKKNKVKDKMKKQLKKAKHTLHIHKKKEDKDERKDKTTDKEPKTSEKEHKSKWS